MIVLRNKESAKRMRNWIERGYTLKRITKHIYLVRLFSTRYKKYSIYILCLNFSGGRFNSPLLFCTGAANSRGSPNINYTTRR